MKQLIEILSAIGTTIEHSPSDRKVIHIVNRASLAAIFFSTIFLITNSYSGYYDTAFLSFISIASFALVPFLNYQKKYLLAKKLFVGIGMSATAFIVSCSQLDTHMYYYFISVFAAMLMLFPEKRYFKNILLINLICIPSSLFISHFDLLPKLHLMNPLALGITNIFLIMVVVFVLIYTIMKENYLSEQRTAKLLANIHERNLELNAEKEKVETTAEVLIETNAYLHQEVIEREKVEKSLRESNQILKQFTYVASHDMKEPLRTISSFSNLLARRIDDKLDEREREYLNFITDGVTRMSVLVDDLLKFAPLSNPVTFEEVDLNNTLVHIKHSLINLLERKNGTIEVSKLPTLYANRSQLNQLFQNLISNGLKFNKKDHPQIKINCKEQEDNYLFSVIDNGIGIPKAYQEQIWMLFQRLHNREQFEGSGIGLAIAKKVVTNHQGQIWIKSEPDQGTTFYFTISKKLCTPSKEVSNLTELVVKETARN